MEPSFSVCCTYCGLYFPIYEHAEAIVPLQRISKASTKWFLDFVSLSDVP